MKSLRKTEMKYQTVDEILRDTQGLLIQNHDSRKDPGCTELPAPILFELANPMARFSCNADNKKFVADSVAESLYLVSGMNGTDFIYPFRQERGLTENVKKYEKALGTELRFQGQKSENVLDYRKSNSLRQRSIGFTDQLARTVEILKSRKDYGTVIQFSSIENPLIVHYAWFRVNYGRLDMLISAGDVDDFTELYSYIIAPFTFLQQIISELTNIPMGSARFMIGHLYSSSLTHPKFLRSLKIPIINTHDFQYPESGLTLRDVDTLISIMVEFVERLDENSLNRANPFDGDDRVQLWQDYAEVFRAWKAEQLNYKVKMEQNFYHPQLRFIYRGETV